ncbi:hypothetical protein L1Q29_18240, partial [Klebsiella pneumoniae]
MIFADFFTRMRFCETLSENRKRCSNRQGEMKPLARVKDWIMQGLLLTDKEPREAIKFPAAKWQIAVDLFPWRRYCICMGLPRSWWEGSERHIQLSVVEHHPQFKALP